MFRKRAPSVDVPPEWMIVGLGNPGPEYSGTRHNIGFEVVDALAHRLNLKLRDRKFHAVSGKGVIGAVGVLLVKPLTFMNLSGRSVAGFRDSFKIPPSRILVVADDLDLPVGQIRIRAKGSAGGHNGHKSVILALGTQEYPRIKIGVGKVDRSETIDHVLSKFHPSERDAMQGAVARSCDAIEAIVDVGLERAMTQFNGLAP